MSSQLQNVSPLTCWTLQFASPKIAEVVRGKKIQDNAKSVGSQTIRKQLSTGSSSEREEFAERSLCTGGRQAVSFQESLQNREVGRERQFYKHFSLSLSSYFWYQHFVPVLEILEDKSQ